MGKRTLAVLAALLAVFGAAALRAVAEGNGPASAPTSKAAPGAANGQKIVSDRTMADINEAETAMKEQSKKESATSAKRWATGVYTDHSGYVFKYGLSRPVKEEPGVKYPLHIGTPTALAMPSSQGQYPCYTLAIYIPDTILTPVAGGYKMPPDINLLVPSGYKGVIDKVLADYPNVDASRIWVSGASKYGVFAWGTAYQYPDTIAAVMPSAFGYACYKTRGVASRGIGIWIFQGMKDGTARPAPGAKDDASIERYLTAPENYKDLHDAGYGAVMYTEYTNGDHHEFGFTDSLTNPEWNDFTRLRKWLFEQRKPAADWPIISSPTAALASAGKPFSYTIAAGNKPQSFHAYLMHKREAIDPATNLPKEELPEGLSLDPKTGVISGTPQEAGRFFIRLRAVNGKGSGITTLVLTVKGDEPATGPAPR